MELCIPHQSLPLLPMGKYITQKNKDGGINYTNHSTSQVISNPQIPSTSPQGVFSETGYHRGPSGTQ